MGDIRKEVADRIVAAIEVGVPPWHAGWRQGDLHQNLSNAKPYKGINQLLLAMSQRADPRWMTFKQASLAGCRIKKGEHGTRIVKMVEVLRETVTRSDDTEVLGIEGKKALVLKAYTVFNAEQLDGVPPMAVAPIKIDKVPAVEAIGQGMVQTTGLTISEIGNQPCYLPSSDTVRMPRANQFKSQEDWSSTYLHELAHATGHPDRMNRPQCFARFGSELYAKEELRAELASAMLCGQIGLTLGQSHIESHAAYVSSWLDVLRRDKNEIFRAAAEAQRICDYLGAWIPAPDQGADQRCQADACPQSVGVKVGTEVGKTAMVMNSRVRP